jgi:two-component system sensor histidine kinase KdpD
VLVLLVNDRETDAGLDPAQRELADAFAQQTAATLERLRLAEQARQAALSRRTEELRAALLSAVSHDLRTPLGAITGAATTLMENAAASLSDADRAALLTSIAEQGFALERLVSSLLDMTRVEAGAIVLRREWVPVEELVGTALARVGTLLGQRTVTTDLAPNVPLLHVDPVLFEQVVANLLDNAAKHTGPTSRIRIDATSDKAGVELAVVDDGPGLPEGIDIFEKFVRGPGQRGGGLGLGLAICKSIVDAHGGTIRAQSPIDGGARFTIRLAPPPAVPDAPDGAQS